MEDDDMIALDSMTQLMNDFSMITGLVFMLYEQYVRGEVIRKNEPKAIQLFSEYIKGKILEQGGDGTLIRESAQRLTKEEDEFREVPHELTFTKAFFMYHIDKFFSRELNVVLYAIDDEYDKFLASQKKQQDDL